MHRFYEEGAKYRSPIVTYINHMHELVSMVIILACVVIEQALHMSSQGVFIAIIKS